MEYFLRLLKVFNLFYGIFSLFIIIVIIGITYFKKGLGMGPYIYFMGGKDEDSCN